MPTFFNLPNSGSAEWAATYAIIHICHTRADQTRPGLTRLGLPGCSALLSCVIYANVKYFEMPLPCERKQTEVHYKVLSLCRPSSYKAGECYLANRQTEMCPNMAGSSSPSLSPSRLANNYSNYGIFGILGLFLLSIEREGEQVK